MIERRRTEEHVEGGRDVVVIASFVALNHILSIVGNEKREDRQAAVEVDVIQSLQQ